MPNPHATSPAIREYKGMCDASASTWIDIDHFVVASDEDNILRIYRLDGSEPIATFDWSAHLGIAPSDHHPEADIEAAVRVGDRVYWITSHGTNKDAKPRPNRRRFFATDISRTSGQFKLLPVGTPFRDLVEALVAEPELAKYKFAERSTKAPESEEGLNIEGLTATPDGHLLIGFRNPVPDGNALLVPLENPIPVLTGGANVKLGGPILINVGERGIRSIDFAPAHNAYFIVAGPIANQGKSELYRWSGSESDAPVLQSHVDFAGLNPEAVLAPLAPRTDLLLLSDDGDRTINGVACKEAAPAQRRFRSLWVSP